MLYLLTIRSKSCEMHQLEAARLIKKFLGSIHKIRVGVMSRRMEKCVTSVGN